MNDLLMVIVAGIEIIFAGSEFILEFMNDTTILGATLYAWFLGYLVLDTIISLFASAIKTNVELSPIVVDDFNNQLTFQELNDKEAEALLDFNELPRRDNSFERLINLDPDRFRRMKKKLKTAVAKNPKERLSNLVPDIVKKSKRTRRRGMAFPNKI